MKKILQFVLIVTLVVLLTACTKTSLNFVLVSYDYENYDLNSPYVEKGFTAENGDKEDISSYVTVENNIDDASSGNYLVTYTLDYNDIHQVLERTIYYREPSCDGIYDTNQTVCFIQWSEYLDTYVTLKIYYEDDTYYNQSETIFNNIELIISKFHELSDKYNNYNGVVNVKTINDNPTEVHTVEQALFDLIEFSLDNQDDVNNLFNIALGPVLSVWHDYRDGCFTPTCAIPTMAELNEANAYTNSDDVILDSENSTITMSENMSLDLGGISKGYISDQINTYLDSLDLSAYLLNNGTSNISIGGIHPVRENGRFVLGITDPSDPYGYSDLSDPYASIYATVTLGAGDQMITSGDYQKYFISNDELYHHIINPITLMPDRNSRSVSIISNGSAGLGDLYSTAIFTMTITQGQTFVNGIEGLEAIWYSVDGEVFFSENFEELYLDQLFN